MNPYKGVSTAGMECFYSFERTRMALAAGCAPDAPGVLPRAHLERARTLDRSELLESLLEDYARQPTTDLPGTLRALGGYCGLGRSAPLSAAAGPETLRRVLTEIFRWTCIEVDPRGTGPLRLWFVSESVVLAGHGRSTNPGRNMTDPYAHLDWSAKVPVRTLIRDLVDKIHEQFARLRDVEPELLEFCAGVLGRCVAWGGPIPGQSLRSGAPAAWTGLCRERLAENGLWPWVDLVVRGTGTGLLARGRATGSAYGAQHGQCLPDLRVAAPAVEGPGQVAHIMRNGRGGDTMDFPS